MAARELNGRQKAAILMICLGTEASASVMQQMTPEQLEELTLEIASLGTVEPETKAQVLEEFHQMVLAREYISFGGIDYARKLLEETVGEEQARAILTRLESNLQELPFDFIRKADPVQVLNFIANEHPQTIALILAHLPPTTAATVLGALPEELQSDVVGRMAVLDQTAPDIVREIEAVLESKMIAVFQPDMMKVGGVENVAQVLTMADRSTEKNILMNLQEAQPDLADEIRALMFVFDDVTMVNDAGIQRVLKEIDNKELGLALKAANDEVKEKIFSNMSTRAADMIREDMEYMGPVRLRDVEAAQSKIVDVIRRLDDAGELMILGRGEEDEIVE